MNYYFLGDNKKDNLEERVGYADTAEPDSETKVGLRQSNNISRISDPNIQKAFDTIRGLSEEEETTRENFLERFSKIGGVGVEDLTGPYRGASIKYLRFAGYFILREFGLSYPQIAELMGRDHTSVMHGYRIFKGLIDGLGIEVKIPTEKLPSCTPEIKTIVLDKEIEDQRTGRRITEDEFYRIFEAYEQGLDSKDATEETGVGAEHVQYYYDRFSGNAKKGKKRGGKSIAESLDPILAERVKKAMEDGMTLKEVLNTFVISIRTAHYIRRKFGIKTIRTKKLDDEKKLKIIEAQKRGMTEKEAAVYAGVGAQIVGDVWDDQGLESISIRKDKLNALCFVDIDGNERIVEYDRPKGIIGIRYLLGKINEEGFRDPRLFWNFIDSSFEDQKQAKQLLLSKKVLSFGGLSWLTGFRQQDLERRISENNIIGIQDEDGSYYLTPFALVEIGMKVPELKQYPEDISGAVEKLGKLRADGKLYKENKRQNGSRKNPHESLLVYLADMTTYSRLLTPEGEKLMFQACDRIKDQISEYTGLPGDALVAVAYLMKKDNLDSIKIAGKEWNRDDFFKEVQRVLSLEEKLEELRKEIVVANLRWAVKKASKKMKSLNTTTIKPYSLDVYMDLIQAANIGLQKAVERFDWTNGFRLSTYSDSWILQTIDRNGWAQERFITLPERVLRIMAGIKRRREFLEGIQEEATVERIASDLDLDPEYVQLLASMDQSILSLNYRNSDSADGEPDVYDSEFGDVIANHDPLPEDVTVENRTRQRIRYLFFKIADYEELLSHQERDVLLERHGFKSKDSQVLAEIGFKFGVSSARIEQIEKGAYKKLRSSLYLGELRELYDKL